MRTRRSASSRRSGRGFTVLEMIVVLCVLSILSMVAATAYDQFVDQARAQQLASSAGQVVRSIAIESASRDKQPSQLNAGDVDISNVVVEKGGNDRIFIVLNSTSRWTATRYACVRFDVKSDEPGGQGRVTSSLHVPDPMPAPDQSGVNGWDGRCPIS